MTRYIGLAGFAGSGKNAVGKILEGFDYHQIAFADAVRDCIYRLAPRLTEYIDVADFVDHDGWDVAKKNPEVRRLLQVMGTEVGRNMFGQDAWINATAGKMNVDNKYVFTDVRFENEAQWIKLIGGKLWYVDRPGVQAVNNHISEHALAGYNFDAIIRNEGSLEDLKITVSEVYDDNIRRV